MKIALLGYGIEGKSAYRWLKIKYPDAKFSIYDGASAAPNDLPDHVEFIGKQTGNFDVDADLVIRTPSIAPSRIKAIGKLSSVTQEFFEYCPAPVIAVTGTKGKGTTASLIAEMLREAGKNVYLLGNIGVPAFDEMESINNSVARDGRESTVVIYELSSYQAWNLPLSPQVAVVLGVEPEHLDVHADLEDYVDAKTNIARHQAPDDTVIFYEPNQISRQIAAASAGRKIGYTPPESNKFVFDSTLIAERSDSPLLGIHNTGNIMAACLAAWQFTQDNAALKRAIEGFSGLEHRLEIVRELKEVTYVNDSFSTAPTATLAALHSFKSPILLILGGHDKGADNDVAIAQIVRTKTIKYFYLIGETAESIAAVCRREDVTNFEICGSDFEQIIKDAQERARINDIILLSPGAASFGMFTNYSERGEKFKRIVAGLI